MTKKSTLRPSDNLFQSSALLKKRKLFLFLHAAEVQASVYTVHKVAFNNDNNNYYYYYFYYCNIEDVIKNVWIVGNFMSLTFNFGIIHCASHCISQTFCTDVTKLQTLWQTSTQHFVFPKDPPTFLWRGFCPPDPLGAGFNVDWNRVSVNEILESLDNPIQVMRIIIIFTLSLLLY